MRSDISLGGGVTDPAELRRAYGMFPTGVVALCAVRGEDAVGMAMSSFVPVSLEPALVACCVQNTSTTWPLLRESAFVGVSVLGEDQGRAARQLAGKADQRFVDLPMVNDSEGRLYVEGAATWMSCSITSEVPAGDHSIVLLEVHGFETYEAVAPLVFHASGFTAVSAVV